MKTFRFTLLWLLGAVFIGAGAAHLYDPDTYAKMVPPYLPAPAALVLVSGLCEIALGVLIFPQKTRPYAAWGLIALLVAVFPANVHMATHADEFPKVPPAILWLRLPFQAVLIAWAYRFTGRPKTFG